MCSSDLPQVITSLTQLLFFMTPIVWTTDALNSIGANGSGRMLVAKLNPMYHYIEILRAPLIGNTQSWHHWAVVGAFTVVGWSVAVLVMRNYRARISYWV